MRFLDHLIFLLLPENIVLESNAAQIGGVVKGRGKAKKKLPRARTELLGETLVVQLPENATAPPKKKKRKKNAER